MLAFFFNRFSFVVRVMEIAGLVFWPLAIARMFVRGASLLTVVLTAIVIFEYAFIRYCTSRRWYKNAPRFAGIELQFLKALVPASYIMALSGAAMLIFPSAIFPAVVTLFLAFLAHVNVILLYLKSCDKDPMPVNFFSNNIYCSSEVENHVHTVRAEPFDKLRAKSRTKIASRLAQGSLEE